MLFPRSLTSCWRSRWLLEVGEGDYTGRRRQTLLRLNPGWVRRKHRRQADGKTRDLHRHQPRKQQSALCRARRRSFAQAISTTLGSLIERARDCWKSRATPRELFGVGISLAGVIYSPSGMVHYSPFFGWKRYLPLWRFSRALKNRSAGVHRKREHTR
ncbi:MAG: hypothetical protein U0703_12020 [Anaerolineae bacterium]